MNYSKRETTKKQKLLSSKSRKIKKKFSFIFFQLVLIAMLTVIVIVIGSGLGAFNGIISNTPDVNSISIEPEGFSSTIYTQKGREIQKLSNFDSNRIYVSLDKIPEDLQNAFIAIEDSRFYEHNGIDIRGIIRAAITGIKNRDLSQGASTITQQLLKNNVFSVGNEDAMSEKIERKLQEQYLAIQVEKKYSKQEILEYYLNSINLGQSTLGVQAAALEYFNKDVSELSLSESTVIAAITQNPTKYDPIVNPESNAKRRAIVLKYMLHDDMITEDAYTEALNDDVYDRIQQYEEKDTKSKTYSYFIDALIEQVISDLQEKKGYTQTQAYNALYRGGLKIYSTQDTSIQKICDSVFSNPDYFPVATKYALSYQLSITDSSGKNINYSENDVLNYLKETNGNATLNFDSKEDAEEAAKSFKESTVTEFDTILGENIQAVIQPQASFVLMDQTTGYVKALIGGRGEKNGNLTLNRATTTTRQPGSTFKVVSTFVPALDTSGLTLASTFDDCLYCYDGTDKVVNNYYDTGYRGMSSIREAIRDSMNVVTAKTMSIVTPQIGYDYLMNMGFTTLEAGSTYSDGKVYSDVQQTLCLGGITKGVTNLELTAAYATIANQGTYNQPILYTKILDDNDNVILDNSQKTRQVMKESTSWLMINAMKDVVNAGTGTSARLDTNMPCAGKTGTTSNNFDHWFCGMTPYYTASIWCGYDNNTSFLTNHLDLNIWKVIMDKVIKKKKQEIKDFPDCADIVTCEVCSESGKLPIEGICDQDPRGSCVRTEYFAKGTEPTETCNVHTKVRVCKDTNMAAGDYCPATSVEDKVYIIRPEDSQGKTADSDYELPKDFLSTFCTLHTQEWMNNTNYGGNPPTETTDTPTEAPPNPSVP